MILPVCAAAGANGLPVPPVLDVARIERPVSPNTAAAAGWAPEPDMVTPVYPGPAGQLLAAIAQVAGAQCRTLLAAAYPDAMQLHWMGHCAVFNFPDLVMAQVIRPDPAGCTLLLYSGSVYGYGDFGVNRQRLTLRLAAPKDAVRPLIERSTPL